MKRGSGLPLFSLFALFALVPVAAGDSSSVERTVRVTNGVMGYALESIDEANAFAAAHPELVATHVGLVPGHAAGFARAKAIANGRFDEAARLPDGVDDDKGMRGPVGGHHGDHGHHGHHYGQDGDDEDDEEEDGPGTGIGDGDGTPSGEAPYISFQGPSLCGCEPPDPILTIGTSHVLLGINDTIRATSKSTGTTAWSVTWENFFASVNPAGAGAFTSDPKVFFDPGSQRYFATILYINSAQTKSWWVLAVSTTDQITNSSTTWQKWAFDPTVADPGKFADYPSFGFDENAIYITSNMFSGPTCDLAVFPKAQLLVSTPVPTFTQLVNVRNTDNGVSHTLQPAHMFGSGNCFFVNTNSNSGSKVYVYRVNNPLGSPTLTKAAVNVTSYSTPPNAAQQGTATLINTNDTRLLNAVWRNDSIYCAHAISSGGFASARWYQINTASWPAAPTLTQSGTYNTGSAHYYYPTVAVNQFGDMAMGFTRSKSTEFASAWHTSRFAADPAGTMATATLDHSGTAGYTGTRWGDFSGTSIDPVDMATFWVLQEYSAGTTSWGTWVTSFQVTAPCTAPTINAPSNANTLCGVAFASATPSLGAGTAPITWSLSGSPPAGMTINPASGVVSWPTPVTTGSPYTITLVATNACGADSKSYQLTVNPNPPTITPIADTGAVCSTLFTLTPATTGGAVPLSWSLGGTPPPGMTIDPSTGTISWPNPVIAATPYTVVVQADSAAGCGGTSDSFDITVIQADLNGDGIVSALDIPYFVDQLVGLTPPILCAADLNNDGLVNGDDAQLFIDLLP